MPDIISGVGKVEASDIWMLATVADRMGFLQLSDNRFQLFIKIQLIDTASIVIYE